MILDVLSAHRTLVHKIVQLQAMGEDVRFDTGFTVQQRDVGTPQGVVTEALPGYIVFIAVRSPILTTPWVQCLTFIEASIALDEDAVTAAISSVFETLRTNRAKMLSMQSGGPR